MTTLTAWFLIVSGVTYGGFVSYSPPLPTKAACEKFQQNLYPSLQHGDNFSSKCVENTIFIANTTPTAPLTEVITPQKNAKKSNKLKP